MLDLWLGIVCLFAVPLLVTAVLLSLFYYVKRRHLDILIRVFSEKPLFIIPRGEPRLGAEEIRFPTFDGMMLRGCYIPTKQAERKGVILFGLEFGSTRWACQSYCEGLLQAGYDVFAFEPRNQGGSDSIPGYDPLQWLTRYETQDMQAAAAYLKTRDDADPRGIGFFGLSKGANAGLVVASRDSSFRCLVTDGAFGTLDTVVPYMRKWISVYSKNLLIHGVMPSWFYRLFAAAALRKASRQRHVEYIHIERDLPRLKQPLLMIHGAGDSYIKAPMAQAIFNRAGGEKDFWLVPGAKHNLALQTAGEEYIRRVVGFFDRNLSVATTPLETMLVTHPTIVLKNHERAESNRVGS